jgi:abhydrolase domain-containing protein 8
VQAGHRVVAFDALGHGRSPAPRDWQAYRGEASADDLRALVERHASSRNLVVGHSYGCLVALSALLAHAGPATTRPPLFDEAFLLAPPPLSAKARPPWWVTALPVPILELLRPQLSAGFRAKAWGLDADPKLIDEETAISDRNSLYVFKALWRQRLDIAPASLSQLKLPVRLIAGEADQLTPPVLAEQIALQLPDAQVSVLPRCGHQIPLERPDAVIAAILGRPAA